MHVQKHSGDVIGLGNEHRCPQWSQSI